jgi:ABC-2 type transport system permease protein
VPSQITATRAEEADGHADHLLARPVSRWRWLAGRLAVTAALIIAASLTAGLAGWAGVTGQHTGLGFT